MSVSPLPSVSHCGKTLAVRKDDLIALYLMSPLAYALVTGIVKQPVQSAVSYVRLRLWVCFLVTASAAVVAAHADIKLYFDVLSTIAGLALGFFFFVLLCHDVVFSRLDSWLAVIRSANHFWYFNRCCGSAGNVLLRFFYAVAVVVACIISYLTATAPPGVFFVSPFVILGAIPALQLAASWVIDDKLESVARAEVHMTAVGGVLKSLDCVVPSVSLGCLDEVLAQRSVEDLTWHADLFRLFCDPKVSRSVARCPDFVASERCSHCS